MANDIEKHSLEYERFITIGLNIAFLRKKAKLTQAVLAEKADISSKHLSDIENPNMIQAVSLKTLFRIADALGVPIQSLFDKI